MNQKTKDFYIETCLKLGKVALIHNIENDIDSILDPLLEKDFIKVNSEGNS